MDWAVDLRVDRVGEAGFEESCGLCGDGTSPPQFCLILILTHPVWNRARFYQSTIIS